MAYLVMNSDHGAALVLLGVAGATDLVCFVMRCPVCFTADLLAGVAPRES